MSDVKTAVQHVTSADGTTIAYRALGSGPGVVLLHGMMQSGPSNIELARALAGTHTCYVPDRRGRGASGPRRPGHSARSDVEDVCALLDATGARDVIGVSAGAIIALLTALSRPDVRRVVAFEPPLGLDGAGDPDWIARFDREIAEGRIEAALVTGMLAARLGPPGAGLMPRRLLERLTTAFIARQERDGDGEEPGFRELAPTIRHDGLLVAETADLVPRLRELGAEVLLLGGTRSPAYLKRALTALEGVLPHARRVVLKGVGHEATGNAAARGKPELVAREIGRFLT
ncbi:alpha/beta fold hydrolase [Nonomuraea roseoviolacea]|uniref:Pimeloyl-ACP methyl ester carboxylesterase n=1 Tax=Nonomuraea roseoviolacea subsp. carminata TaxID=160689 RepID=A0ABT1KDY8_9ACTN|nr:alpha/beta hydrolase [Nonomuraea roseoviolacea]MCP2352235.1 pimeloyl-ACP methyl ester carboxylesterase [Nonomuraea roseoviolacea subsp. carminata]